MRFDGRKSGLAFDAAFLCNILFFDGDTLCTLEAFLHGGESILIYITIFFQLPSSFGDSLESKL